MSISQLWDMRVVNAGKKSDKLHCHCRYHQEVQVHLSEAPFRHPNTVQPGLLLYRPCLVQDAVGVALGPHSTCKPTHVELRGLWFTTKT